jgi:hypothetical protein
MSIRVNGTTVINDSRGFENISNLKTIKNESILGSGNISINEMTYPSAGIPVSAGASWGTSLTAPNGTLVGTTDTQTLTNKTISTGSTWSGSAIAVTFGGTGQTSYLNGELLIGNSNNGSLNKTTLTAGSNVIITNGPGTIQIAADITGTIPVSKGGTGITSVSSGQVLIGNSGGGFTPATIQGGGIVSVSSSSGSITISASGGSSGTVTSVGMSGGSTGMSFSNSPITSSGTMTMSGTLAVGSGGTGSSSASGARTNLGLDTNSSVQFSAFGAGTSAGTNGTIRASGDITAFATSDFRLKTNIVPISNPLQKLKRVRGVTFDWTDEYLKKNGGEDGYFIRKNDVGVIAQEIEKVLPEVVAEREDGTKAVKYDRIVSLLIEAVKELSAEVEALKAERNV